MTHKKNSSPKPIFIAGAVIIVVLVIVAGLLLVNRKTKLYPDKPMPNPKGFTEVNSNAEVIPPLVDDKPAVAPGEMVKEASRYIDYDPAMLSFADLENNKIVLFFNASWCPTCRGLTKNIQANVENIPEDLLIMSVDYDSEKELRQKYQVTYQHTLVQVDSQGNLIGKWSGSPDLPSIIAKVQ